MPLIREYAVGYLWQILKSILRHYKNIVMTKRGNTGDAGTYIHEELVVAFARWLSPDFSVWCDQQIHQLLMEGYAVNPKATED